MTALLTVAALAVGGDSSLQDVTFEVERCQVTLLAGGSHQDRAAILDAVAGHRTLASGSIRFDGDRRLIRSSEHLAPSALARRGVTRVWSPPRLWPGLTVEEHLHVALGDLGSRAWWGAIAWTPGWRSEEQDRRARVAETLSECHLDGRNTARIDQLAAAERARLEWARALVRRPLLVLAEVAPDDDHEQVAHLVTAATGRGTAFILAVDGAVPQLRRLAHQEILINADGRVTTGQLARRGGEEFTV